jgi:DNA-binding MarR family transcriptional regulator
VVVQRLVERGLVVRVDSERDRRRTELRATASAGALSPLGERQTASLSRGLQALARGLRAGHAAGDPFGGAEA